MVPRPKYKTRLDKYARKHLLPETYLSKIQTRCKSCEVPLPGSLKHYEDYGNYCYSCDRKSDRLVQNRLKKEKEQRANLKAFRETDETN